MSLTAELNLRLDASTLTTALTGELTGAGGDLGGISFAINSEDVGAASGAAGAIDLSALGGAVTGAAEALGGATADLPGVEELTAPIRGGLDALASITGGTIRADLEAALGRLVADAGAIGEGDTLSALRRLAEGVGSSDELTTVTTAADALIRLAGGTGLPQGGQAETISGVLTLLEAIGAMMTLETLLAQAARLGGIAATRLPEGGAGAVLAAHEAAVLQAEQVLDGLDTADDAAVGRALEAFVTVRVAASDSIELLRTGMATGEATLALIDPAALDGRVEAVLGRLRAATLDAVRQALADLAGKLAPIMNLDLSGAPQFALETLIADVESRADALAGEIAAFDPGLLTAPITETLSTVTSAVASIAEALDAIVTALTDALGRVRDAVAALPLDTVAGAIRDVVGVIAEALGRLTDLLGGIEEAIGDGAEAALAALGRAESAIDTFLTAVENLFRTAKDFIDALGIDAAIGEVADGIQTVADLIGQADMAPYFQTAQDAIGSTASVVDKVPFELLPDEMEQDLVDLIRPIKTADLDAFAGKIKDILQIGEDGTFTLRPDIEAGLAGIQAKIDELVDAMAALDPRQLTGEIDLALGDLRTEIEAVAPQAALGSVTEALDQAKAAVAALDVDTLLAPLREGFDAVLAAVDGVNPATLLAPVEAEIATQREALLDLVKLREWRETLNRVETEALAIAATIDPTGLEAPLTEAFGEARRRVREGGLTDPLMPLGTFLSGLLAGGGEAAAGGAMRRVAAWLRGSAAGGAALEGLASTLQAAIADARARAGALDPTTLAPMLATGRTRLAARVEVLAPGAGRDRLAAAAVTVDLSADLSALAPGRERYLAALATGEARLNDLAARGFGEVDTTAGQVRQALAPLVPLLETPQRTLERLGFAGLDRGLTGILDQLFEVATPARLAGILTPVYAALHGRIAALIAAVLDPVRALIDELIGLVEAIDLSRITTALGEVHAAIRAEIAAFHPDALLGEALTAFTEAREAVAAFDPLGPVIAVLDELKATIIRVLGRLDGDVLLATPIAIYDDLKGTIEGLDIAGLVDPLLDQLDAIAAQVDEGLDGTVEAFAELQDALPGQVGSTSISGSVSVSVGAGG